MLESEKAYSAEERKKRIRERYKGVDKDLLEVIPAKAIVSLKEDTSHKRVAAYCRVSTDDPNQTSSYELQRNHYEEYINEHPGWELVGIYADEGISGTSLAHREEFNRMIADCEAGMIDLVITKSIARFARNTVDSIETVRKLARRKSPVGVLFETENLYTLNQTSEMILTVLSAAAQEESHTKSEIMNVSIEHRFSRGIFLLQELLGFDKDEDGNLVVNEEEAETVKVIYYLYLNGFSLKDIADLLTEYGRKTKKGNVTWSTSSLRHIMQNERQVGDVLARKTWTPDYLDHKSRKNDGDRNQYIQRNHHEGNVSREVFDLANRKLEESKYTQKGQPIPIMRVIDGGALRGYVPVDKNWGGFTAEDYHLASQSAYGDTVSEEQQEEEIVAKLNMSGYQIVRAQFFSTASDPAMTISHGKLRFNTACMKRFEDVEYVELLLNSVDRCIAIRPCGADNPNAIHWGTLRDNRWKVRTSGCKAFSRVLFGMMDWKEDLKYKFRGEFRKQGDNCVMMFYLDEPEVIKVTKVELPPEEPEAPVDTVESAEGESTEKKHYKYARSILFPAEWMLTLGRSIDSLVHRRTLVEKHYAGNWDVLAPGRVVEECNWATQEQLNAYMQEAEMIMEGWEIA